MKKDLKKEIKIVASQAENIEGLMESGKRWVEQLIDKCIMSPGMRVLDFGAGLGRLSIAMRDKGMDVTAIERRPAMVEFLKENKIRVIQSDDMEKVIDEKFDLVTAMFVFQHMGKKRAQDLIYQASLISDRLLFTIPTVSFFEDRKIPNPYIIETGQSGLELFTETEKSYCYYDKDVETLIDTSHFFKIKKIKFKNVDLFECFKNEQ